MRALNCPGPGLLASSTRSYSINIFLAGLTGRKAFQAAITEFERNTCIRFTKHTQEKDYIWVHHGSGWVAKIYELGLILENLGKLTLIQIPPHLMDTTKQSCAYHICIEANFHPNGNEYHFLSAFAKRILQLFWCFKPECPHIVWAQNFTYASYPSRG